MLVNKIGPYEGSKAIGVREDSFTGARPGAHVMNINADGNWNIQVERAQIPNSSNTLPYNLEGTGDSVSKLFTLDEGLTTFTMSHDGSSNFIIQLLSMGGQQVELLANEIGAYEGKKAVGIKSGDIFGAIPGIYILSITADGNWSVSVSQ